MERYQSSFGTVELTDERLKHILEFYPEIRSAIMKTKNKSGNQLFYFFDQEADVFYMSQGKPSAHDNVTEGGDDILLRTEQKTGKVRGFTILNFSKHQTNKSQPIALPIHADWAMA